MLALQDSGVLEAILNHSPHGVIVCDATGRLILQNRAAERIWAGSATATDVAAWKKYRAFHPDGRPFEAGDWTMAKALQTRAVIEAQEFHILRFDDSEGYLLGSAAPILGPEGELRGGIAVFADVTGLKEAQAKSARLEGALTHKVAALEAVARRASQLQRVTGELARVVSVPNIAEVATSHAEDLFGATAAALYATGPNDDELRVVATTDSTHGGTPAFTPLAREIGAAFREGQMDLTCLESPEGPAHVVLLPLRGTTRALGMLVFGFSAMPELDGPHRDFFLTLASHCGTAIERAYSFEAVRVANERLESQGARLNLLAEAGQALASSLDSREAVIELVRRVVPTIADWCAIDEFGDDGQIRRLAVHHRDPERVKLANQLHEQYPPRPDDNHGVVRVLRTGEREFVPYISDELLVMSARDEEHLALARTLALTSFAVIPIRCRGRVLGALTIVTECGRTLKDGDVDFSEELAGRAALALDNARLFESESAARTQLHDLFMQAPAAIAIVRGADPRWELANAPYTDVVGLNCVGLRLHDDRSPSASAALVQLAQDAYAAREVRGEPELEVTTGTDTRFLSAIAQPILDRRGRLEGVATFAFEVSDQVRARRKTEQLLSELGISESRMRALVEAMAVIVWTSTPDGRMSQASESWLAFTGQTPEQCLGDGFLDAVHLDDRERTAAAWRDAVALQRPFSAEYRLRRSEGTYAHMLARACPVTAGTGCVLEYVGCSIDVTELRRAETLAKEHAESLATINELDKLIAAELDTRRVVQAVTDAAIGLTRAEFGAFFYRVVDDEEKREHERGFTFPLSRDSAVLAPTFAGAGIIRVDDLARDSTVCLGDADPRSYMAVPVVSRQGEIIGGLFLGHREPGVFDARSETLATGLAAQAAVAMDNAKLFENAQQLIVALEATNRELDQFAYVTSHDLKAPLRGIASLAAWIEEDIGASLTSEVRRKLDLLHGRVRRMEGLIQGILDYSRAARTSRPPEAIDVGRLVHELGDILSPGPSAAIVVAPGLPVMTADRVAVEQVFMNLIGNGLKHADRADAIVRVEGEDCGGHWRFAIIDNGPGIEAAYHERIWGIFQTLEARDKVENTGIGLAIVRKIVERNGGRTWIESVVGRGSTFFFTWPKPEDWKP